MPSSPPSRPSLVVGTTTAAGVIAGALGIAGWRYCAPRQLIFADSDAQQPGAAVRLVRVNYLLYVSGPSWWPIALVLPAIGMVLGAVVGLLILRVRQRFSIRHEQSVSVVAAGAVAAATGAFTAVLAHAIQPDIRFIDATGQRPPDYYDVVHTGLYVYGAPTAIDINPIAVTFPLIGGASGIAVAAVGLAILRFGRPATG